MRSCSISTATHGTGAAGDGPAASFLARISPFAAKGRRIEIITVIS
jgi:hypothetical protein